MQKGPELSEIGDLDGVLPDLVGQVTNLAPKWIGKMIKGNPEIVNQVIKYAKENPDKAKDIIGKFIKIKPKAQTTNEDTMLGL